MNSLRLKTKVSACNWRHVNNRGWIIAVGSCSLKSSSSFPPASFKLHNPANFLDFPPLSLSLRLHVITPERFWEKAALEKHDRCLRLVMRKSVNFINAGGASTEPSVLATSDFKQRINATGTACPTLVPSPLFRKRLIWA